LSRYPSQNAQQIPTFSLWYIEMLHDYWMYRADDQFVKAKLQSVRSVLDFFQRYQQNDGRLKNAPYWEFTDWVEDDGWKNGVAPVGEDGSSAATDLLLCLAYRTASVLEDNLGMKAYATIYLEKYRQLKQSIIKNYWNQSLQLFADTKGKQFYSQHVNSLAILADVVEGDEAKFLMEKILNDEKLSQATIYFKYYVHQALKKAGLGNRYIDLLSDWRTQLQNGLTTWAEISDDNNARSDCHAWGSSPNIEFFRIVLGIDTDAPGFAKVVIEPHLGPLSSANGSMPHPYGKIAVKFQKTKQHLTGVVTLPPGLTGRLKWNGKEYPLASGDNKIDVF
jgi:alpha-L-rhamnosidase